MIKLIQIINEIKIQGGITHEQIKELYLELLYLDAPYPNITRKRWDIIEKYIKNVPDDFNDFNQIPKNKLKQLYKELQQLKNDITSKNT